MMNFDPLELYKNSKPAGYSPDPCMIYAAFVTMKNLSYMAFSEVYVCSIDEKDQEVPFDPKYGRLKIFYNNVGSRSHPDYKTTIANLSDVWLIGKSYWDGKCEYWYEDNTGVNHENARKALKEKGF